MYLIITGKHVVFGLHAHLWCVWVELGGGGGRKAQLCQDAQWSSEVYLIYTQNDVISLRHRPEVSMWSRIMQTYIV